MGDLLVNDVPDALRRSLEKRADEAGHSISDEVKAILEREVSLRHRRLRDQASIRFAPSCSMWMPRKPKPFRRSWTR